MSEFQIKLSHTANKNHDTFSFADKRVFECSLFGIRGRGNPYFDKFDDEKTIWKKLYLDHEQSLFQESINRFQDRQENIGEIINSETDLCRLLTLLLNYGYDMTHRFFTFILNVAALKGYLSVAHSVIGFMTSNYVYPFPLTICCMFGRIDILKFLIQEFGVDIDNHDSTLWTCLVSAAGRNRIDIVRMLLDIGCDINYTHELFMVACDGGSVEIVSLLIERNIDLASFGSIGFFYALKAGHYDIINLLIPYKIDFSNISLLSITGMYIKLDIFKLLITSNLINSEDYPHILIDLIRYSMMNEHAIYLLELINKIDGKYLIMAVESMNYEIVHDLVKYGADPYIDHGICFRIPYQKPYSPAFLYSQVNGDDLCNMYELFMELGLQNCQAGSLNKLLEFATDLDNKTLINLAIKYGADITICGPIQTDIS